MPRTAAVLLALLVAAPTALALTFAAPAATPAPAAEGPVIEHLWIPSFDGVKLRATWFAPDNGTEPFPLILRTHGWAQVRQTEPVGMVGALLERGYAVLTWDSRGFGESEGFVELNSPDYEVKDVSALLSWAAANRPVRLDAPGDPRVGMTGGSYAGGIQLLAGAFDPRFEAIVPEITWHDLRHSLGPNGVLKVGWVALLYLAGQASGYFGTYDYNQPDRFYPNAQGPSPALTQWLAESLVQNRLSEATEAALAQRSIATYIDLNPDFPPTMLVQGWQDTLFTPNEAAWTHAALRARGHHANLLLHGGGHGYGTPDEANVTARIADFLDYWILETTSPVPADVEAWLPYDATWQVLPGWQTGGARLALGAAGPVAAGPGAGSLGGGEPGLVVVPATVAPAAFTEVPNFQPEVGAPAFEVPGASAVFATAPLPALRDVVGAPRARLVLAGPVPDAALFLKVLDLPPSDNPVVVGRQVTPVRVEGSGAEVVVELELTAIAHRFEEGHRLGLAVGASDAGFLASRLPLPVVLRADGASWVEFP